MGIGKPEHKGEVSSYVLGNFNAEEQKHLAEWISKTADAVEFLLENSIEDTSSKYTVKKFKIQ